jgi:SNF2 family DNA or RNA helicase
MQFNFKTQPYEHQKEVFDASWDSKSWALFLEMGTGKTKVTIDTLAKLYCEGEINAAVVIAPKGVYGNWVAKEIPQHMPDDVPCSVVLWQPNLTQKFKAELLALTNDQEHLKILVMNVESFSTKKGPDVAAWFMKRNPNCLMAVDESTSIKNRTAKRTKSIIKLGKAAKYRRILTGSPITKNPMDLYAQCAFLGTNVLGFESFYAFQGRYAVMKTRKFGNRSFQEITGYRNLDELNTKLQTFSSRILKEDCLDLPEKIYMQRQVPLTKEQESAYKQMKEMALAMLEKGELSTTQSVLTQIMRLQEICCGHLKTDDGPVQEIPNNRMGELLDVISEMNGKVIIWASWVFDIGKIKEELIKVYGPRSVCTFYGDTPTQDRDQMVADFQDPDNELRFFVANPRTGGYGLTLTAATNMVYYSNQYDLEIRLQSEDRAHRIGQTKHVLYVDLVSPDTVDEKIIAALRNKIDLAQQVLGEEAKAWLI